MFKYCFRSKFSSEYRRASRICCKIEFPIYCVPLSVVLGMTSVESHEELLARGVLVEHKLGDTEPIIFVSHQWVSMDHPDPDFTQFAVLQGAIRRLLAGDEVRSDWLHSLVGLKDEVDNGWATSLQNARVWYDYFSVPQAPCHRLDTISAIQSIPAYVEMATFNFILAPTIDHREHLDAHGDALLCDSYSWEKRGWCRLELFAMCLKVSAHTPVVIRSERYMHFMAAGYKISVARVAEGEFTCCRLNHMRTLPDGTIVPVTCDKLALFPVVDSLITRRLHYERRTKNLRGIRQFLAYRHIWLRHLRPVEEDYTALDDTLDNFLTNYAFRPEKGMEGYGGWTPLRFACVSGNVPVVRQLLEKKADPDAHLVSAGGTMFPVDKGSSILAHVIVLCCCQEHEDILDLLVTHKAKLHSVKHMDALTAASSTVSLSKRGARWLLRTFPDWDMNTTSVGQDSLGISRWPLFVNLCLDADIDYVRLLCEHHVDLTLRASPVSLDAFVTACTLCPTSSFDIAEYILSQLQHSREKKDTGAYGGTSSSSSSKDLVVDLNRRMTARRGTRTILTVAQALNIGPRMVMRTTCRFIGSTPLLYAASEGKHRVCRWLLDHKADASIANMKGETALSLAKERGFAHVVDVLLASTGASRVK
eukprot:GEMP01009802.1.p1 GENE.GEMP01009802.1~~GEMP01009802.1.p1  ORF type:complete len:647 (+),score=158.03 GEMP01009802.1:346-2286(+)